MASHELWLSSGPKRVHRPTVNNSEKVPPVQNFQLTLCCCLHPGISIHFASLIVRAPTVPCTLVVSSTAITVRFLNLKSRAGERITGLCVFAEMVFRLSALSVVSFSDLGKNAFPGLVSKQNVHCPMWRVAALGSHGTVAYSCPLSSTHWSGFKSKQCLAFRGASARGLALFI